MERDRLKATTEHAALASLEQQFARLGPFVSPFLTLDNREAQGYTTTHEGGNMRAATISANDFPVCQHAAPERRQDTRLSLASDSARESRQSRVVHLTPRQREVLALLCEGLPNKLICRRLNISSGTVKAHISSILRELGVASRVQAVVVARNSSLLRPDYVNAEPSSQSTSSADRSMSQRKGRP